MERFEITGSDKRSELIQAVENGDRFIAQKPYGVDVERFDEDFGFYLARKETEINPNQKQVQRAYAIAKLSLQMPKLGLRELYYVLRQNPELIKYFDVRPESLYQEILERINTLEILADVDRIAFTISTSSKGYIFYPFSYKFGDKRRRVAFTEELAVETIQKSDLPHLQSAIVIEKEAAANRLIEMGFPQLTNSAIITVGGMFNRAIFRFTQRFAKEFPFIFFADGDVFGSKILSTVVFGSARSRHLSLRSRDSNVNVAGLFPFVGDKVGLPNDVEEKRPLQNKEAQKMLEHLKKFGLVDDMDIKTWESNKTFELEALSTSFTNNKGEPIGLGIYLTEFMRLKRIPPKPLPDDSVKGDFEWYLKDKIRRRLTPKIDIDFIKEAIDRIEREIEGLFDEFSEKVRDGEFERHEGKIDDFIDKTDVETIKKHLIAQYCRNMRREKYNVSDVADKAIEKAKTEIEFDNELFDEIREEVDKAVDELIQKIKPKIERLLENAKIRSEVELKELRDVRVCNLYDKILEELGAKPEDAKKIREALKLRLGVSEDE